MNKRKKLSMFIALALSTSVILSACSRSSKTVTEGNENVFTGKNNPKYVFLFIGDGMAMPQIDATEIYLGKKKDPKQPSIDKLTFTQFQYQGMNTTYAADTFITDSASAGTAIATGNKTNDGVIDMDPGKTNKYKSISEMAKDKGMKVGIVSSVSIDHATPATFYAHNASRNNYYDIAKDLAQSNFDYFGGGGFLQPTGKDKDKEDVVDIAKKNGFKYVNDKDSFEATKKGDNKVIAVSPKLDSASALPYAIDNNKDSISLADFTKKGIDILDNDKGFFMMVEGGKVDWACHANDAATSIQETIAFNESIKQAVEFYNNHKDETLIVVTADHETGGFTIGFNGTGYQTFFEKLQNVKSSFDEVTKKVQAYKKSVGTLEKANFEDALKIVTENYGLTEMDAKQYTDLVNVSKGKDDAAKEASQKIGTALSPKDIADLKQAFNYTMMDDKERAKDETAVSLYGTYDPFTITATHILNSKAGIGFTSYAHTGVPVPIYAKGVGGDLFTGYFDDTDIFKKLKSIMSV